MGALSGYYSARLSKSVWDETRHPRDKRGRFASGDMTAVVGQPPTEKQKAKWEAEDKATLAEITKPEGSDRFSLPEIQRDYDGYDGGILERKIETPLDYIDAVKDVLVSWLASHTNPEANITANLEDIWNKGESVMQTVTEGFDDDLRRVVAENEVGDDNNSEFLDYGDDYGICPKTDEYGDETDPYDYLGIPEETELPEPTAPTRQRLIDALTSSTDEAMWRPVIGEDDNWNVVEDAYRNHFKDYREWISGKSNVDGIIGEVYGIIKQIERAQDPAEQLNAAMWGSHQLHVHGNIVQDYGWLMGVDYSTINAVQQESPEAVFGAKAMQEFFAGKGKRTPRSNDDE